MMGERVVELIGVFLSGVIVSFTPCLYPVLPVAAGSIAQANINGSRTRAFVLSLIYVLGMALVYAALAVAAAWTGAVFGRWQNSPAVYGLVALVFLVFALVMFDVIRWSGLRGSLPQPTTPRGGASVFFLGAVSGLLVGPCTAPALGTLLMYVAAKEQVAYAVVLMVVFAYGMGMSLILAGTFSGFLSALPKPGPWMIWIKRACGAVFAVTALVYALRIFIII